MKTKLLLIALLGLLAAATPVLAHHALAAKYDTRQSIMLKGTITKISWDNPHVHLYVEAAGKGAPESGWQFEMGSPNLLLSNGWKLDTFRRGDLVVVTAYPARDGSHFGYASKVALSSQ